MSIHAPADPRTAGNVLYNALTARAQVHVTHTKRFDHLAASAFNRGWQLTALASELTRGDLGNNPGGVITTRLERCGNTPPPETIPPGIPFCTDECRNNAGWVLDPEDGQPVGRCDCRTTQENSV